MNLIQYGSWKNEKKKTGNIRVAQNDFYSEKLTSLGGAFFPKKPHFEPP